MENHIKRDDLGFFPLFLETPIYPKTTRVLITAEWCSSPPTSSAVRSSELARTWKFQIDRTHQTFIMKSLDAHGMYRMIKINNINI